MQWEEEPAKKKTELQRASPQQYARNQGAADEGGDQTRAPDLAVADPDIARLNELLITLLAVDVQDTYFYAIVKEHLSCLVETMALMQEKPDYGIAVVRSLYEKTTCDLQKALLVFIASAARESDEALSFFRAVMADLSLESIVRATCVAALGMANLPITDVNSTVRWHYATVLWATANQFKTSHPTQVYVAFADEFGMGWPLAGPWPKLALHFGWQGQETRVRVLQILIDALNTETCLRTRHFILKNIWKLEDDQLLIDVYQKAFVTDDWKIPEGHFSEGTRPIWCRVVLQFGQRAVETRGELWVNALKWVQTRIEPWDSGFEFIVEPLFKLDLIDMAFVQKALYPFTLERPREELVPKSAHWLDWVLWRAKELMPEEEFASLMVQVARGTTATADRQIQMGLGSVGVCLSLSKDITAEEDVLRILLGHTDSQCRGIVVRKIATRGKTGLIPDLVAMHNETTCRWTYYAVCEALEQLAPETLASLPERKFPTTLDELAEMVRKGEMSPEEYEEFLKKAQGGGQPEEDSSQIEEK
jgi:hypothetical protein